MKKLITLIIILILIPLLFTILIKRVPPATIGVKQNQWAGAGIVASDYPTGFHIGVSGVHKWYFLPAKTHFLHFNANSDARMGSTDDWAVPLEIRTTDNNVVTFELSISYRIRAEEAHLIVDEGMQHDYRDRVRSTVTAVLRSELPLLTSEDLQDTDVRLQRVEATLPVLNKDLEEFHCVADSILIRRLRFQADYEEKLQEKQYLRQKALLDTAETGVAEEEKTVNLIEKQIVAAELTLVQDWDKRVQEKKSEYDVLIATIVADAEVYAAEVRAEGKAEAVISEANGRLALEKSEALRNELRTAALNSEGGRILLGLEAAQNLNIPTVTLNSDDPAVPMILDLGQLTRMLVGETKE
jgi:hypothetical protein